MHAYHLGIKKVIIASIATALAVFDITQPGAYWNHGIPLFINNAGGATINQIQTASVELPLTLSWAELSI